MACFTFLFKPKSLRAIAGRKPNSGVEEPLRSPWKTTERDFDTPSVITSLSSLITNSYEPSHSSDSVQEQPVPVQANFIRTDVPFGESTFGPKPGEGRFGYSIPEELLQKHTIRLGTIPKDATLSENGFEMLDIREQLAQRGITEETFDVEKQEHRRIVGAVLMEAAERRFPGMRAIHLADTSRVSGTAVYGEATARCTGSKKLRAAQHIFHIDKFLPGIARLYGSKAAEDGAKVIVDEYWSFWEPDFTRFGVDREQAVSQIVGAAPGMLNLWAALTPGGVQQHPLAVADMRNILIDDSDMDCVSTHAIVFPGLKDTITVLRPKALEAARLLFRPRMRFGEVIMFSTIYTPHSAVWIQGQQDASRCSAEIRLLLVDKDRSLGA